MFIGYPLQSGLIELISVNRSRHPNNPAPGTAIIIFWEVVCMNVCVCVCVFVCMYVCICVCLYAL